MLLWARLQRNANGGAMLPVIEAAIRPVAVKRAGCVDQYAFSIRLAVQEQSFIPAIAKDEDAAAIRQAVGELAIILAGGPALRTAPCVCVLDLLEPGSYEKASYRRVKAIKPLISIQKTSR